MSEEISSGVAIEFEDAEVTLTIAQGVDGLKGESAYQSAVKGGYNGSEEEFVRALCSIREMPIVQESGQRTDVAMSQKAVTDQITGLIASAQIRRIEVVSELPAEEQSNVLYIRI